MSETHRLSLPVDAWPEADRQRWAAALEPADFLEETERPGAQWSARRRRIVAQAYGQWLAWLDRQGLLEPDVAPGARVTEPRIRAFLTDTGARVSPVSLAMMLQGLQRMLVVLAPETDWAWLRRAAQRLKETAQPARDKRTRVVSARALFELGVALMDNAHEGRGHAYSAATRFRDGLLIALLAARPLRLRNLAQIVLWKTLAYRNGRHWLMFPPEATKTGAPIRAAWPEALEAYLERYLLAHRKTLLAQNRDGDPGAVRHLWVSRWGAPLSSHGIHDQIKLRTRTAFGQAINPHLFRDCVATSIAVEDPEHVRTAAAILGHSSLAMTEKHYNQATSLQAGQRYQTEIDKLRRQLE